MTNVACFHGQHFLCLEVFKLPLVLIAFAITLKGSNTLKGNQRIKENQDMILRVQGENLS